MRPTRFFLLSLTLAGVLCSFARADDIDDLLAKRQHNFDHVKRMRLEMTLETERPAMHGRPARQTSMRYAYTLTRRDKTNKDPAKRFDVDVELLAPLQMHMRIQDGEYSFLNANGKWIKKPLSDEAATFLANLSDRHAGDAPNTRQHFDVRHLPKKDNLWGTKKGIEFIPKGKAKLYARREETVDTETGQSVLTELYDDKGHLSVRINVRKLGNHNGITLPDEQETDSFASAGRIHQISKLDLVEVNLE